jgi:formylglycine-generating enzyme required for sulfatase activity
LRSTLIRTLTLFIAMPILTAAASTSTDVVGDDGAPMVRVPAGEFLMGTDVGEQEDEKPQHRVSLSAFLIDAYEVTVSRYAKFLEAEDREPPFLWAQAIDGDHRDRPVIGVDWYDASAYCRWAHKRLPTEAEWEKAARGTDGRIYPWGNAPPTASRAKYGGATWKGYASLARVGSHAAGKSPYGVHDLAGNAWEWVADRYEANYYQSHGARDPKGPSIGPLRILRGGSWNSEAPILRAANRSAYVPSAKRSDFGFRCARDVSA